MSLRLRNENDETKTLSMNLSAWFHILELAENFGWLPMGAVTGTTWLDLEPMPAGYDPYEPDGYHWNGGGEHNGHSRKVLLEDALNLADALERAFIEYEPERAFEVAFITLSGRYVPVDRPRPGIGTVAAVIEFCREGAFLIERR